MALQRAISAHNQSAAEKIRIRIGLHTGEAIKDVTSSSARAYLPLAESLFGYPLDAEPDYERARAGLARVRAHRGEFTDAESLLDQSLESESYATSLARGDVLLERFEGMTERERAREGEVLTRARQSFRRSAELSPELPGPWARLG